MNVGVLALQGNFREHRLACERLGVRVTEVRLPDDLEGVHGLIIPGGESTTIGRLAREFGLEREVRRRCQRGQLALWGTCAGAIWIANEIQGRPNQENLGLMNISVARNAYGRQVDSFVATLDVTSFETPFPAIFIRAPGISSQGAAVQTLARYQGQSVLVREGLCLASTFHPELTGDDRIHRYFLSELVESVAKNSSNLHREEFMKK